MWQFSNTTMSPHDDKSFHDELLYKDPKTMTTNIIAFQHFNAPILPKWRQSLQALFTGSSF